MSKHLASLREPEFLPPDDFRCSKCGYMVDTPNHELGCELGGYDDDGADDVECTHCGGEGLCWDGSDPLGNCPDDQHRCHACGGSGKRSDQTLF